MGEDHPRRGRTTNMPQNDAAQQQVQPPKKPVLGPVVTPPAPTPAPTPVITPVRRDIIVSAYSFCGFVKERPEHRKVPGSQCPHRFPWNDTEHGGGIHLVDKDGSPIPFDRKMAITSPGMAEGTYDGRDPAIMDWTLKTMEEIPLHSIRHQFEASWPHMDLPGTIRPWWALDYPGQPYMMEHFIKHHAAANTPIKVSAAFWQRIVSADDARTYFEKPDGLKAYGWTGYTMLAAWKRLGRDVGEWMKSPNWETVDDKLVFTLGYGHTMPLYKTWFPNDDADLSPANLVKAFRDGVREVTGKEVYLMATATEPDYIDPSNQSIESLDERMNLREWNFDGFADYLLHGIGWEHAMGIYKYWRARNLRSCRRAGLDLWAAVTTGDNGRAWQTHPYLLGYTHMPTPEQLTEHFIETKAWAIAEKLRGILIQALDENGEGSQFKIVSSAPGNWINGDANYRAIQRGVAS